MKLLGEIDAGRRFDAAMASAAGWRLDAQRFVGARRDFRLAHARRMEAIAERMVRDA